MINCRISVASLGALFLASAGAPSLAAQDYSLKEALAFCAAFEDDAERLACFEALAETAAPAGGASAPATPPAAAEGSPETPAPAAPDAPESAPDSENDGKKKGFRVPFFGSGKEKTEDKSTETTDSEEKEERFIIQRADEPEVKRREGETYKAEVYRSWRNGFGELRVAFTNGEIWRQVGPKSIDYDPVPGEIAEFSPTSFGGWRIEFETGKRSLKMIEVPRKND